MMRRKKQFNHFIIAILIMVFAIGFAAFSATLKINGTYNISAMDWDVHFANVDVNNESVTATTVPTSDDSTTTEMEYAVSFDTPGQFYEFTVDIVNDGSIDAMVDVVSNKPYSVTTDEEIEMPRYLKSTVTYADGVPIGKKQLIAKNTSQKYKIKVEIPLSVNPEDLPTENATMVFKFSANYKQSDKTACAKPTTFADDSWDTISCNVKNGNLNSYNVGDEKTIEMDMNNDNTNETYTLRVANNTRPEICDTEGFSQSACGFVVEFKDVVENRYMGPYGDYSQTGYGNTGGWEHSDMRAYLNGTTYIAGNIDYSETGFISKLPAGLRNKIIDTEVVSSYGQNDSANWVSTDKIYLLATCEIWGKEGIYNIIRYDSADTLTRQLDYYKSKDVKTDNFDAQRTYVSKKKLNGAYEYWWLRSADDSNDDYYRVESNGGYGRNYYNSRHGVSPAFRLG